MVAAPRLAVPLAALALAAGALAGCGSGESRQPAGGASQGAPEQVVGGGGGANELSASDAAVVLGAYRTIGRACSSDPAARRQVPQAVRTIDTVAARYPGKAWEVGSADRALAMYAFAGEMSGVLRDCGLPGADVLARRERAGRDAAS